MRFAVIGAGVIAPSHVKAIVGNSQAELVGIADVEVEKAGKIAADFRFRMCIRTISSC